MIMPEHLLQCHPFVGKSFLSVTRNDEENDSDRELSDTESEDERGAQNRQNSPNSQTNRVLASGGSATANAVERILESSQLDRPRGFVINDGPGEGPSSWWAV